MYSQTETHSPSNGTTSTVRRSGRRSRASGSSATKSPTSKSSRKVISSNRLYMAPQARITRHNGDAYGGVTMGDGTSAGIKSNNTRRRRRKSPDPMSNISNNQLIDSNNNHRGGQMKDFSPTILDRQDSDSSLGAMAMMLEADRRDETMQLPPAPMLWNDNNDTSNVHVSPKMTMRKKVEKAPPELIAYRNDNNNGKIKKTGNGSKSRNLHYGHEDFDETALDGSLNDCEFNLSEQALEAHLNNSSNKNSGSAKRWWNSLLWSVKTSIKDKTEAASRQSVFTWAHCAQIAVLIVLVVFVYDSHTKVQSHKMQLREYDEERSHILEQMMWIDKAAKRVHKKYSDQDVLSNLLSDPHGHDNTMDTLKYEKKALQAQKDLQAIQHNIQLNARNQLASTFGENPAQVALQIPATTSDEEKLLIGLSDDTPHAISTLVQQVNQHLWDEIHITSVAETHAMELRSKEPSAMDGSNLAIPPLLEFVERSRGCHDVGSVFLRQQDPSPQEPSDFDGAAANADLQPYLVVSVYLSANKQSLPEGSVCIGNVLQGLEALAEWHHHHSHLHKVGS